MRLPDNNYIHKHFIKCAAFSFLFQHHSLFFEPPSPVLDMSTSYSAAILALLNQESLEMSTAPLTKALYYRLRLFPLFSRPFFSMPISACSALRSSGAPPGLLWCSWACIHMHIYLNPRQRTYAVTCTIRWRRRETAARNSAGNKSAAASARRRKRLTVSQTSAAAIWSALPVPVGHLPTLGKA